MKRIVKAIYLKYFSSSHQKDWVEFKGRRIRVIEGTIHKKVDKDDNWLYLLLKHSNVFFDIGTNKGYVSLLGFLSGGMKKALLVDANETALLVSFQNMMMNGFLADCTFFNGFVSDQSDSTVRLYTIGDGAAGSMYSSHAHSAAAINSFVDTTTVTLDDLQRRIGMNPDLIKIDVEGAESQVLAGATHVARQRSARFFIEMHSLRELTMEANATRVIGWCQDMRYTPWYLRDECELKMPDQISDRGRCHLLLQPDDWSYPDFLKGIKEGSELPSSLI